MTNITINLNDKADLVPIVEPALNYDEIGNFTKVSQKSDIEFSRWTLMFAKPEHENRFRDYRRGILLPARQFLVFVWLGINLLYDRQYEN